MSAFSSREAQMFAKVIEAMQQSLALEFGNTVVQGVALAFRHASPELWIGTIVLITFIGIISIRRA
jgi:hypothetical protein